MMTPGNQTDGSDIEIVVLAGPDAREHCNALACLLIACVQSGASVGFMAALAADSAVRFWQEVADGVERGERLLLLAKERHTGRVVGTVQIVLKQPENQAHRADLAKMLVSPDARRRGIGARLLRSAEEAAGAAGKTLLVLDTASGGEAERLYGRWGWERVGMIPDYALWPDGRPCSTTVFYKRL